MSRTECPTSHLEFPHSLHGRTRKGKQVRPQRDAPISKQQDKKKEGEREEGCCLIKKMENIFKAPCIYIRQSHKALTYCYLILLLRKDLLCCCSQKTVCVLTADTRRTKKSSMTHCFMTIFYSSKWAFGLQRCTCCQQGPLKCNKGPFSHLLTEMGRSTFCTTGGLILGNR